MKKKIEEQFIENVTNHRSVLKFPSHEDLNGAAMALMRLQDTYKLDTSSIARGELNGVQYSTEMSSHDCFEMGRQSYANKDYYHTLLWMNEALARLSDDKGQTTMVSKADILEYLAFAIYKQGKNCGKKNYAVVCNVMNFFVGDVHTALKMTDELLALVPNHERALGNKFYYKEELAKLSAKSDKQLRGDDGSEDIEEDQVGLRPEKTLITHVEYFIIFRSMHKHHR